MISNSNKTTKEILEVCKESLTCIARLTPFPSRNMSPELLNATNQAARYADKVRARLRKVIEIIENE